MSAPKPPSISVYPYGAKAEDFDVVDEIVAWSAEGDALSALEALGEYGHKREKAERMRVLAEIEGFFPNGVSDLGYNALQDLRKLVAKLRSAP